MLKDSRYGCFSVQIIWIAARQPMETSDKKVGDRVRHLRQCHGYKHANTFAAFLGIPATRWNNIENGFPLSR
jgi:hypothetical protein